MFGDSPAQTQLMMALMCLVIVFLLLGVVVGVLALELL
jgi:hypothetical protein